MQNAVNQQLGVTMRGKANRIPLTFSPGWFKQWDDAMTKTLERKRPRQQATVAEPTPAEAFVKSMRDKHSA